MNSNTLQSKVTGQRVRVLSGYVLLSFAAGVVTGLGVHTLDNLLSVDHEAKRAQEHTTRSPDSGIHN
jgi:hypothetical protein